MNYYISDLHLFHEASIKFDNRPFGSLEEMHSTILSNWNGVVTNGDTVYILGDMSMRGKSEDLISFVARLKGKKILIKGNHDDISDYRYKQLFAEICDYKEIQDCVGQDTYRIVMCHYPVFSWNKMSKGTILLYGHTHDSAEDLYFQRTLHDEDAIIYRRHLRGQIASAYNVGCMKKAINYTPRSLQEIIDGYAENTSVDWEVSESINDGLFYKFSDGDHAHGFSEVLEKILKNPQVPDIEGEATQYSRQELRIIQKLHEKLKV